MIPHRPAVAPTCRTTRGLTSLHEELLSFERGVEPSVERLLRVFDALSETSNGDAASLADRCTRMGAFLRDLREDGPELGLEDLDVLLENLPEAADTSIELHERPSFEPGPATAAPVCSSSVIGVPEFRDSGLQLDVDGPWVRLRVPPLEDGVTTAQVLDDLAALWSSTPSHLGWWVDLALLETIPVALLAQLNRQRGEAGSDPRRIALGGVRGRFRAAALLAGLERRFELE